MNAKKRQEAATLNMARTSEPFSVVSSLFGSPCCLKIYDKTPFASAGRSSGKNWLQRRFASNVMTCDVKEQISAVISILLRKILFLATLRK